MDCKDFRKLYKRFTSFPLPREVSDSAEYSEWNKHLNDCSLCGEWYLFKQVEGRGVNPADYPCIHVAYHSTHPCDIPSDSWECPDMILVRTSSGFGIPVRDGGTDVVRIEYCPWCGTKLSGPGTAEPVAEADRPRD